MISIYEIINTPMRVLSWKEPFGTLMLHGKIETRTRNTAYKGLVLICTTRLGYMWRDIRDICGAVQNEICKLKTFEYIRLQCMLMN